MQFKVKHKTVLVPANVTYAQCAYTDTTESCQTCDGRSDKWGTGVQRVQGERRHAFPGVVLRGGISVVFFVCF